MVSFKRKKNILSTTYFAKKKIVKVFTYIVITNIPVGKNSNFLGFSQKKILNGKVAFNIASEASYVYILS